MFLKRPVSFCYVCYGKNLNFGRGQGVRLYVFEEACIFLLRMLWKKIKFWEGAMAPTRSKVALGHAK